MSSYNRRKRRNDNSYAVEEHGFVQGRHSNQYAVEEESGFGQQVHDTSTAKILGKELEFLTSKLHKCNSEIEKKKAKEQQKGESYKSKRLPGLRETHRELNKEIQETYEKLGNTFKGSSDGRRTDPKNRHYDTEGRARKQRPHLPNLTNEYGQDTSEMQSCRDCLRKDKDILDLKEQLNRSNRYEHKRKCPECEMNEATVSSLHDHIKQLENQIEDTSRQIDSLKQSLKKERNEKEDALTRLSSLASSKLRDNNPNITDLSDQNRPTKIAEKMSELYDNEWTEAFDSLEQSKSETDIIVSLSGVLKEVFEICTRLAWTNFFENIQAAIYLNIKKEPLSDHFKQQVKEYRKLRAPGMTKHLAKVVWGKLPRGMIPPQSKEMMAYFNKCLEVSWLAAVQDPPLALNFNPGEKFDTALFKDYTKRGPYVEFLVWPALHLHENGPLLTKGVAQGCHQKPFTSRRPILSDPALTPQFEQPRSDYADRHISNSPRNVLPSPQYPNHPSHGMYDNASGQRQKSSQPDKRQNYMLAAPHATTTYVPRTSDF